MHKSSLTCYKIIFIWALLIIFPYLLKNELHIWAKTISNSTFHIFIVDYEIYVVSILKVKVQP